MYAQLQRALLLTAASLYATLHQNNITFCELTIIAYQSLHALVHASASQWVRQPAIAKEKELAFWYVTLRHFEFTQNQLERRDIETFRLLSEACRHVSEPIIFRTLTLHDVTHLAEEVNENICERLQSPNNSLSQCVRHLKVGPLKQEKNIPSVQILGRVLLAIESLQDFSWNVFFAIPQDILNTFHKKWLSARLHVYNTDGIHRSPPLDTLLLSSPQLHSFHFVVLCHRIRRNYTSEFPVLRPALLSAKSLKSLRLKVADRIEGPILHPGPANLQFADEDVFPALQELALPFDNYKLTRSHYQAWLKAMDWSKLRSLDLDGGAPRYLLEALTGCVPQLKALKFGFLTMYQVQDLCNFPDLGIVRCFLESIEKLEELHVQAETESEFEQIKDVVYDKHGKTLRTLKVRYIRAYELTSLRAAMEAGESSTSF